MTYKVTLHYSWSWKKRSRVSFSLTSISRISGLDYFQSIYNPLLVLTSYLPSQIPGNWSDIWRIEESSKSTPTGVLLLHARVLGAKTSKPYGNHALHSKAAVLQERSHSDPSPCCCKVARKAEPRIRASTRPRRMYRRYPWTYEGEARDHCNWCVGRMPKRDPVWPPWSTRQDHARGRASC